MPLATPKPSGEWQAANSVQASRILGAVAGDGVARRPGQPAGRGRPDAERAGRACSILRREMGRVSGVVSQWSGPSFVLRHALHIRGLRLSSLQRRHVDRPVERLRKIGDDVVGMLDADRQPHIARRDAGRELSSGENCECVVEAGWMASERASPILATW